MIAIDDVLVSDEILESYFACNLEACKGACCWEGDWGAPLEEEEVATLREIQPFIEPYLSDQSQQALRKETSTYYKKPDFVGTPLHDDGACVYLAKGADGISKCGIEMAYEAGAIDFIKPVSCHLYPIRVEDLKVGHGINYDRWHICSPACAKGSIEKMPLIHFVRDGLVRRFGKKFYQRLMEIYNDLHREVDPSQNSHGLDQKPV